MAKKTNPAPGKTAAGLGIVVTGHGVDTRENTLQTFEHQQKFVARHARLNETHAALVAALVFGRAA